jgi:Domain of unknown function (DUF4149)
MNTAAVLVTSLLFGGTALFSFAFAAFLLKALPVDMARATIRRAFPHFYLFVIITAAIGAALFFGRNNFACYVLALISVTTIAARQVLMPAINNATDSKNRKRFGLLHGASVLVTLTHIVALAVVLSRLIS